MNTKDRLICLFNWCCFNRPAPFTYIRSGWNFRARKRVRFTSKTLAGIKFSRIGPNFPYIGRTVRFETYLNRPDTFWRCKRSPIEMTSKANLFVLKKRTTFLITTFSSEMILMPFLFYDWFKLGLRLNAFSLFGPYLVSRGHTVAQMRMHLK